ncbi:MAG: FKBP-type peptidyl-prolyl cis-trans isomerase [Ignavibacteriales bacterium]|nr:FKBP-type peptidyl-prolyl cis-trans isomerase [Ignavibacteriales bacterium]MCB9219432.1 FKBP-type peptidyl-prolyl cis-trans isomerase [Ignavibacteriales bacterium]
MKQILIVSFITLFSIIACSQTTSDSDLKMTTAKDSVSYSIGLDIGNNFKRQEIEIEPAILLQGIKHAMADTSLLSEQDLQAVMTNFRKQLREQQQAKNEQAALKNKEEADKFFAENKTKEGVITLESGLQYKVLKSGNGKTPKLSSTVEAHYAGRLLDGTEFDNSYKRGAPFQTKVTGVIKGWTEILQLMKEGDKWEVYIPSDLAYGPRGSGPTIGPNAALIFEMELISVN